MFTYLISLLTPPTFADAERSRVARQLYYILLLGVPAAASFLLIAPPSLYLGIPWSHIIAGSMVIIMITLLWLLRRGYVRLAGALLLDATLLAVTTTSATYGGIRDSGMFVTPLLLTLCSVLLGSRATTILGAITALIVTLLFISERTGVVYWQPRIVDTNYFATSLVTIGLTVVILHLTVNQIVQSAQRIHQQAIELQDKNQQLEQIQSMLEIRTHELSNLNAELQLEMSERARTETILRQNQKLESIGLLAGGVAHDFNNLLTSILTQSSLALRNLAADHKAYRHLEKSITSVHRAADLTRQLLAYAGKSTFQIEPLDLNQLIQENLQLLETAIQKNSALYLDLQLMLPAIESDRGQIQQVLMNLVINAAEAIQHDHGVITVATQTVVLGQHIEPLDFVGQAPGPGEYVNLTVQDNGAGMISATLERIFDPYFSTKAQGHGLGLSAVLGAIHALHGGLQVASTPGQGSCFRVYLPTSKQGIISRKLPANGVQPQASIDKVILVVDDEKAVREAATEILHSAGYRTLTAANGNDGLELFRDRQAEIGMVLLDVLMPGINGPETMEQLRTIDQNVKVILTSGYSEQALFSPAQSQKPSDFLPKPYTIEELIRRVAAVLKA